MTIITPLKIKKAKMFENFTKIIAAVLIPMMLWGNLAFTGSTRAAFFVEVALAGNSAGTGVLNFSAVSESDFSPEEIFPGSVDEVSRVVDLEKIGTIDLKYRIRAVNFLGDASLCQELQMKTGAGDFMPLTSFASLASPLNDPVSIGLTAKLTNPETAGQNKTCLFDLEITGWQADLDNPDSGFTAQKLIPSQIKTGGWVVINELMWMGSLGKSDDEWLELRNLSGAPVDIGNWQITKLTDDGEELMLELPVGAMIPANGFYVISRIGENDSAVKVVPNFVSSDVDLRNRDLQVRIYDGDFNVAANLVDVADDGHGRPAAGFKSILGIFNFSMERNDNPGDGALASSWHTCWDDSDEMRGYWKTLPLPLVGSLNRGTPTVRNLSDYDEDAERAKYMALEEEWVNSQIMEMNGNAGLNSDNLSAGGFDDENKVESDAENSEAVIETENSGGYQNPNETDSGDNIGDGNEESEKLVAGDINEDTYTDETIFKEDKQESNEGNIQEDGDGDGDVHNNEQGEIEEGVNEQFSQDENIKTEEIVDIDAFAGGDDIDGGDGGGDSDECGINAGGDSTGGFDSAVGSDGGSEYGDDSGSGAEINGGGDMDMGQAIVGSDGGGIAGVSDGGEGTGDGGGSDSGGYAGAGEE